MKNLFIINPKAGKGRAASEFERKAEQYCSKTRTDCEIYVTDAPRAAEKFLKGYLQRDDNVRIYACGGDGTLFEAVNGAYGFKNAQVGVIPLGSGNDFVRGFTNRENFLSLSRQLKGTPVSLDVIRCANEYAINQCSVGLDAEVAARQAQFKRLPFVSGEFAFALSAVYCLIKNNSGRLTVVCDGESRGKQKLLFCLAANSRWYGGGYMGAPGADPRDGMLDLVTIENPGGRLALLKLLPKYKRGEHRDLPITRITRCKRAQIEAETKCAVNVDGECHYSNKACFEIAEEKISFIVPNGSEMRF